MINLIVCNCCGTAYDPACFEVCIVCGRYNFRPNEDFSDVDDDDDDDDEYVDRRQLKV